MGGLDVNLFKGIDEVERKILERLYSVVKHGGKVEWAQLPPELRAYLKSKGYSEITVDENFIAKILHKGSESEYISQSSEPLKVPESSGPELQKEAVPSGSVKMEPRNFAELQMELWNSEFLNELLKQIQSKYNLNKPSDASLILLFVEYNNAKMTKGAMINLLKERGISKGTAKRVVSTLIGKDIPKREDLFKIAGQDPVSDDYYYMIDSDVFEEIKATVYDFITKHTPQPQQ